MEILLFSLNATVPVVLCMALGMALRGTGKITAPTVDNLSALCFSVFLPIHNFNNVYNIDFKADFSPKLMAFAFVGIFVVVALLVIVLAPILRDKEWLAACVHVGFRTNYIIFGIPILQNMYGDAGTRIAAMIVPVAIIPFNFITVFLFSVAGAKQGDSLGKVMGIAAVNVIKNPLVISSTLGLVASLSGFVFPTAIYGTVKSLSGMTSPICLLVLGAQVTLESMKRDRLRVILLCATRLVFVPAVMMPLAIAAGFRQAQLASLYILYSAPCATSCVIMAKQYHVKPEFTAQVVVLTTMLSGFTTFAGISLFRGLGLF